MLAGVRPGWSGAYESRQTGKWPRCEPSRAVVCCCLLQPWGKILPLWRSEGSKCKSCFFHNVLSELSDSLQLACCNLRNLFAEPGYCQAVVSDASSRWHLVGCQFSAPNVVLAKLPVFSHQEKHHVALWLGGVLVEFLGCSSRKACWWSCVCADHLIQTTWTRPWHALHER